jgi:hypothetical protein
MDNAAKMTPAEAKFSPIAPPIKWKAETLPRNPVPVAEANDGSS